MPRRNRNAAGRLPAGAGLWAVQLRRELEVEQLLQREAEQAAASAAEPRARLLRPRITITAFAH